MYSISDILTREFFKPMEQPWPRPARAWYALAVLFVAYAFAFVDRTILSLLVGPIRADLQISDTQVSLLHGFAFAIFYTFVGIPIARAADTGSRRNIIAWSVIAWSIACAGCGLAKNFWQLFLGRIGVGVGEAGLSPAAYSMLADLFPGRRLGLAMSVYISALYIGAGLSLIIGGSILEATSHLALLHIPILATLYPWQMTFLIVGMPGLCIAGLMRTVREPARRRNPVDTPETRARIRDTMHFMLVHRRAYAGHILGFTMISLLYNVAVAWGPTYLIRTMDFSAPAAGRILGVIMMVCGTSGAIFGGFLTDWFRLRGKRDAALRVGLWSAAVSAPAGAVAFITPDRTLFEWLFSLMLFAASMAFGAAAAGIQMLTPNRMRAQASAAYLFTLNLLAVGLGPTLAALLTDFWFRDDRRVGASVSLVICFAAPLAMFSLAYARRAFVACALLNETTSAD
jgi:MFS family permease